MTPSVLRLAALTGLLAGSLAGQQFVDATASAGLVTQPAHAWWSNAPGLSLMSAGVAVGDVDGDGWDDVAAYRGDLLPLCLFLAESDGTFTDQADAAGVDVLGPISQVLYGDYDDDGDLDMYLCTYEDQMQFALGEAADGSGTMPAGGPDVPGHHGGSVHTPDQGGPVSHTGAHRNYLFANDGSGQFTDVTVQAGVADLARRGASFGDLDGDGLLDLIGSSWFERRTTLARNMGDGSFRDVTPANVKAITARAFHSKAVDFDEDGDTDVLVVADFGESRVLRNEGDWIFSDHHTDLGAGQDENGMGSCIGDYDNDGDVDWFVSAIWSDVIAPMNVIGESGNHIYRNNGDGTFTDVSEDAGIENGGWGWGAEFADLDNDADLDLVHANGWPVIQPYHIDRFRVFINLDGQSFDERAVALGINDPDQGRGVAVFDHEHDGDLDILVNNQDTGLTLYANQIQDQGPAKNWIRVALQGTASNSHGVGARVLISKHPSATGSAPPQTRFITCSSNYVSQSPQEAWAAVNDVSLLRVRVFWPATGPAEYAVLPNQRVVLVEPAAPPLGGAVAPAHLVQALRSAAPDTWTGSRAPR